MRFYDIQIGSQAFGLEARYTSHPDGRNDPGALNIEFDLPLAALATPVGDTGAYVRIWGISINQISQARDFNGAPIKVYGGMRAGFPLSNPAQSGLLVEGVIWQAFGNWVGTNMSLDLIIIAGSAQPNTQQNIIWNWPKGTPMSQAIANALSTASPGTQQRIAISDRLILTEDDVGQYDSVQALAQHINETSKAILTDPGYAGVDIRLTGTVYEVYDGTSPTTAAKPIAFNDLIGQPTWIEPFKIQINTVMRADILVGDNITLPPTPIIETTGLIDRNQSIFKGEFVATFARHVGNYKNPDGNSWITTIDAFPKGSVQ